MSIRLEFVLLAQAPDTNVSLLCGRFGISRKTGYRWLDRYRTQGQQGLLDQSRRPRTSPACSQPSLEAAILDLHRTYPDWGSRKLRALLSADSALTHHSTIEAILRRHGCQVQGTLTSNNLARQRFEHEAPNLLWQMDFKGHFPLTHGQAENDAIAHWLQRLTDNNRNWGFGLCTLYLRNIRGKPWNHKRVYRIYRQLELTLRIKPKKRMVREKPATLTVPASINQVWSMDFLL